MKPSVIKSTLAFAMLFFANIYASDTLVVQVKEITLSPYANEENTFFLGNDDFEMELVIGNVSKPNYQNRQMLTHRTRKKTIGKFIVESNELGKSVKREIDQRYEVPLSWFSNSSNTLLLFEGEWLNSDFLGSAMAKSIGEDKWYGGSGLSNCASNLLKQVIEKCVFEINRGFDDFDTPDKQSFSDLIIEVSLP